MDTLLNMRQAIQDDLTVGDESTLYSPTIIDRTINRARRKVEALFPWPELQDAKKTTTQLNQEYYDYPQNWRSNSIWKLVVDGERYGEDPDGSPLTFDDYLNWKTNNPNSTDKKWANQWRRYFINPTPSVAGLQIEVWGVKITSSDLTQDSDVTIFSYSMPEGNEAIVLETKAMLLSKGKDNNSSQFASTEAKQILINTWKQISKEMAKYEKNMPFFDVPDFFGTPQSKDLRGRFDLS